MKRLVWRILAAAAAALLFMHALMSFGLLGYNEFFWAFGVAPVVFFLLGPRNALTFSIACVAAVTLITGLIWATGLEKSIYYRPFGALADYDIVRGLKVFEKNAELCMTVRKGDLEAQLTEHIELDAPEDICYITDSLGYRNDADYSGQPWVLVGDSYTVSTGVDQPQALVAQVNAQGLASYSIAYPGNIVDYAERIRDFKRIHPQADPTYLVFFYEGNDFNRVRDRDRQRSWLGRMVQRIREYYRSTTLGRFAYVMVARLKSKDGAPDVEFHDVAGRQAAFFGGHNRVSQREVYDGGADFDRLFAELSREKVHVFFIPTKYRVYHEYLAPGGQAPPNAQWRYLQSLAKRYGVPATNLTPALREAAARLATEGELLWRASDTHWNGRGVGVGARAVREALQPASP